tara:strand:- start:444 stop:2558 length:2115 start_codon:yes stop_codon:yes gene_type:complete
MLLRDRVLIGLVCALCYLNFTGGDFHYDDFHSLVENPHIRSLLNIPNFFADPAAFSGDADKKMYRPLLLVTYAGQYALHGYEPLGFLLGNLLLHGLASLLVGELAGVVLADRRAGLVSALFFAAHPLAGEPVNYISSRSESLAACFYIGMILLAIGGRHKRALLSYGLGLMVKSVVLTAPALLWAYDRWLGERRTWREYASYGGLATFYIGIISYNNFLGGSLAAPVRDGATQLFTQLKTPAYYLYLLAMPSRLNVEHQFFEASSIGDASVLAGAALVLSLGGLIWLGRERMPGFALLWSAVVLLPTAVMPLNMLVNERRLYIVMVGLALGLGYLSRHIDRRWQMVWLLCAIGLCLQRNAVWQSELHLWQDAVQKAPQMYRTQANFGKALQVEGRLDEAFAAYRRAIALDDHQADAFNNMATVYHLKGEMDQAISWYKQALERNPGLEEVHQNLADAYAQQGMHDKAIVAYGRALSLDANKGDIWSNYGLLLYQAGDLAEAEKAFRKAIDLLPTQAEPYNNLANIYVDQREYTRAESMYQLALDRQPEHRDQILANMGDLYRLLGLFGDGRACLQAAIALQPANADWHFLLGRLERVAGQDEAALLAFSSALILDHGHVRARVESAELLAQSGERAKAVVEYRKILAGRRDYSRAWYGLGRILDEQGEVEAALEAYREFLLHWENDDLRASQIRIRLGELEMGR